MYCFDCDYMEGAHPRIMEALQKTNLEQTFGYGVDGYCDNARKLIKSAIKSENADVHFLVGGTQTNTTVIAASLRPYEGVVCVTSGHINVHETGAIEATGHKVIGLEGEFGKLSYKTAEDYLNAHFSDETREHAVKPAMIYISQPTETGMLYSKAELEKFREICDKYGVYLYVDGARLGYALASDANDVSLADLARLTDVFYIGGTKVGTLFGEAVVITNDKLKPEFRYMIKRQGGMFAKGRLLGIQFAELFKDGLYEEMGRHGMKMAYRVKKAFTDAGYKMLFDSPTNQQFPVLPDSVAEKLSDKVHGEFWCRVDDTHSCVRFCTSWATTDEQVAALEEALNSL